MTRATSDTLFAGAVKLAQPPRGEGYRVNADAPLLAAFAGEGRIARECWDLGSGVGAVALSLLHADAARTVVLVERDANAAELASRNLSANDWGERGRVETADVSAVGGAGVADLVVSNPPYTPPGRGRTGAVPARHAARSGELGTFVAAARRLLAQRGRACFVYPANETATLLATLRAHGLEAKRLRFVHARPELAARVVLVECKAAKAGGLLVLPAWFDAPVDRAPLTPRRRGGRG